MNSTVALRIDDIKAQYAAKRTLPAIFLENIELIIELLEFGMSHAQVGEALREVLGLERSIPKQAIQNFIRKSLAKDVDSYVVSPAVLEQIALFAGLRTLAGKRDTKPKQTETIPTQAVPKVSTGNLREVSQALSPTKQDPIQPTQAENMPALDQQRTPEEVARLLQEAREEARQNAAARAAAPSTLELDMERTRAKFKAEMAARRANAKAEQATQAPPASQTRS
jgi:hypothetical protein